MGGSFSAQAADLHCQGGVYTCRGKFRDLGDLTISDAGFVYWVTPWGHLTHCQFRDNILMATSFPDSPSIRIVQRVCKILISVGICEFSVHVMNCVCRRASQIL